MIVEARFTSICPVCRKVVGVGCRAWWAKGEKLRHLECAGENAVKGRAAGNELHAEYLLSKAKRRFSEIFDLVCYTGIRSFSADPKGDVIGVLASSGGPAGSESRAVFRIDRDGGYIWVLLGDGAKSIAYHIPYDRDLDREIRELDAAIPIECRVFYYQKC